LLLGAIVTQNPAAFNSGKRLITIEEFAPAEPNTKLIAEDQIQATAGLASAGALLAASDNWGADWQPSRPRLVLQAARRTSQRLPEHRRARPLARVCHATASDRKGSLQQPGERRDGDFLTAPTSGASGTFAGGVNTATTNAQGVAIAAIFKPTALQVARIT